MQKNPMVAFPSFLAYDAFKQDMDAMDLWERIQTHEEPLKNLMTHCLGPISRLLKAMTIRVLQGEETL